MKTITRRSLLSGAAVSPLLFNIVQAAKPTDIRIEDVTYSYEDYLYRTPIKFGGSVLDRATLINVNCTVRTAGGKVSKGFGSMPMGNVWSFPSHTLSYDTTLRSHEGIGRADLEDYGRLSRKPVIRSISTWPLEPAYLQASTEVTKQLDLKEPMPKLCTHRDGQRLRRRRA